MAFPRSFLIPWPRGISARLLGLVPLLVGTTLGSRGAGGQTADPVDPVPIRRILVTPERLPKELEKAKQGILVPIPRAELEAKLAEIAKVQANKMAKPRLVEAVYAAQLIGSNLVGGTGAWTIHQDGPVPSLLPLGTFNLALSKCKKAGGNDAVLGNLDGSNLGLLIDQTGKQAFFLDWSARGHWKNTGLSFDLRLPPCPRTVLELKVPADHLLAAADDAVLVTGPHESGAPGWGLWRFHAAGTGHLEISARKVPALKQAMVLAQLHSTFKLQPAQLTAEFDFQLESSQGSVQEFVLDCPAELQPFDLTLREEGLLAWKHQAADKAGGVGTITVQLRQPIQGQLPTLRIRCLGKLPGQGPWSPPTLTLRNALIRGENLTMQLPPDLLWQRFQSRGFRETSSTQTKEGGQLLNLNREGPDQGQARPTGWLTTGMTHLNARLQTWWKIHPTDSHLFCDLACTLAQGQLFQLTLKIPPGWTVATATAEPKELLTRWSVADGLARLELSQSLKPGLPSLFAIKLRPLNPEVQPGVLDIPQLDLLEATVKDGLVTVSADPAAKVALVKGSVPTMEPAKLGPWSPAQALFSMPWRVQPPRGEVRWSSRPPQFNASVRQELLLLDKKPFLETRLSLEPIEGVVESVDLYCAGPFRPIWSEGSRALIHESERMVFFESLPALLPLGNFHACQVAALQAALPTGERWRLRFTSPLTKSTTLQWKSAPPPSTNPLAQATLLPGILPRSEPGFAPAVWAAQVHVSQQMAQSQSWVLPLITLGKCQQFQGEFRTPATGRHRSRIFGLGQAIGLAGTPGNESGHSPSEIWQDSQIPPTLLLQSWPGADEPTREPFVQNPWLMTTVSGSGPLVHHFGFDLWHWTRPTLPVRLPIGNEQVLGIRVDDRWLDRLALEKYVKQDGEKAQGMILDLPVITNVRGCRIEIIYAANQNVHPNPWTMVSQGALPELPLPLPGCRRLWRLPAGLIPLHQEDMIQRNLPGYRSFGYPLADRLLQSWHGVDHLLDDLGPIVSTNSEERIHQAILAAEAAWRQRASVDLTLGDALDQLQFEYWREQAIFVDQPAFSEAGLHAKTTIPPVQATGVTPFWEGLGLVYVPLPNGGLLTSRRQIQAWEQQWGATKTRQSLRLALAEAGAHGQDRSARIVTLSAWLRNRDQSPKPVSWSLARGGPEGAEEGWTIWQTNPETPVDQPLVLVRSDRLRQTGQALALILILAGWRLCRRMTGRWRFRIWLAGIGASAWSLAYLPNSLTDLAWWPMLALAFLGLFWLLPRPGQNHQRPENSASVKSSAILVGIALGGLMGFSALRPSQALSGGTEPYPVYLLPAAPGEPQGALVGPDLLRRLAEHAQPATRIKQTVVLVSAAYQGTGQGNQLDLEARYDFFCFADKADLILPLSGVDLKEEAFLDGAPAYPSVYQGLGGGYRLQVVGKGWHRLSLKMVAKSQRVGEFQELRIQLPSLVQSNLELSAPTAWGSVYLLGAFGEVKSAHDPAKPQQSLQAQLGRAGQIHLRWQPSQTDLSAAPVLAQEAYYWDLRPSQLALHARWSYDPGNRLLNQLAMEIPSDALVRSVEALLPSKASAMKGWQVVNQDGTRRLLIDLNQPVGVKLQVNAILLLKQGPANAAYPLVLPQPLQVKLGEGHLAYRLDDGKGTEQTNNLAVTNVEPAVFSRFWASMGPGTPGTIQRAFGFRRTGAPAALLLTPQRLPPTIEADFQWTLTASYADLQGTIRMLGGSDLVSFLEWQIPPEITLTEISGPSLHQWSRHESTVQMWFREPQGQATLQVKGFRSIEEGPNKDLRFALPTSRFTGINNSTINWTILSSDFHALEEQRLVGLTKKPPGLKPRALVYQSRGEIYEGVFVLQKQLPTPRGIGWQKILFQGGKAQLTGQARWAQGTGGRPLRLVLDNAPTDQVFLDASDSSWRVSHHRQENRHEWTLTPPPEGKGPLFVNLSAQLETPWGQPVAIPSWRCLDADWQEWTVRAAGQPFRVEGSEGLVHTIQTKDVVLPMGALEGKFSQKSWRAADPNWHLTLLPLASPPVASLALLHQDLRAFKNDAGQWEYLALVDLFQRQPSELTIQLPAGAILVGAALDDAWTTLKPEPTGQFRVTMDGPAGPRRLQVRWRFPLPTLSPQLDGPVFPQFPEGTFQGQVQVPPGFEAHFPRSGASIQENRLRQAQAQIRLSTILAEGMNLDKTSAAPAQLLNSQKRFYALKRQSELDRTDGELDKRWLQLREENLQLAKYPGFETLRSQAEKNPWPNRIKMHPALMPPQADLPLAWAAPIEGHPPEVILTSLTQNTERTLNRITEIIFLGTVFLMLISFVPGSLTSMRSCWPELLLLVALIGNLALGFSFIGLSLILAAFLARLAWLGKKIIFPPRQPAPLKSAA